MAKRGGNFLDNILLGAAIIGGAWLTIELVKLFSKQVEVYSCPVCKADVKFGENPCHNCGSELEWPKNK